MAGTAASAQDPVAPADMNRPQNSASPREPAITGDAGDIIVTATKRRERIEDVAAPISAVTGDQLAKANANSLGDYIARLPGVVFNDYQPGISEVVIRGVAATTYHEQGQTTVGYYLNEVSIVEPGFPIVIPDIDTFDLNRVEVLRGPQGTLFGSSTLGGLVNYIANVADPSKIDAAAEGLIGSTRNAAGGLNYAGKAMVNVPIIQDKLAVRLMALQRYDAGYLDNPTLDKQGTNDFRTRGLRGSVVFSPTDLTKITYLGTYQDTKLDDQTYLDLANPYIRALPRSEPQKTSFQLHSLRLDQDIGFATATVLGSVDRKRNDTLFSYPFGLVTGITTGPDTSYATSFGRANIKTIEGRLASKDDGGAWRWLVGVSYLHAKRFGYDQFIEPGAEAFIDANPGSFIGTGAQLAPDDRLSRLTTDSINEDFGVFGELSWKPVEGLEITGGGRYYRTRAQADVTNGSGFLAGLTADASSSINQKDHGFTPKATISLRPAPNFLFYATYSQGYRVGGANPNAGFLPGSTPGYGADTVDNYEAGIKTQLFRRRLLIDATVFNIDWKDIQARLFGPPPNFFAFVDNAGSANIAGVEVAVTLRPIRRLSLSSNLTYQDAHLTSFLPDSLAGGTGFPEGTRLPGASKWSVANNVVIDIPELPLTPSVEFAHRYLSTAPVAFGNPNTRGDFNVFDARLTINVNPKLRVLAFVNNAFDKFGILSAPFTSQTVPAGAIIRPRTYGLRVDWSL